MTDGLFPSAVRVHPGVVDAALGDLGGAVGVARRSFQVEGVEYIDVDLSAETLEQFVIERRQTFYEKKIVFTRVRLRRSSVEAHATPLPNPVDLGLFYRRRSEIINAISREWYERIGDAEQDPTAQAVDVAARLSRRRALLIAAGVGVTAVGVAAAAVGSCESAPSRTGSWGRSDGGYNGYASHGYGGHGGFGS